MKSLQLWNMLDLPNNLFRNVMYYVHSFSSQDYFHLINWLTLSLSLFYLFLTLDFNFLRLFNFNFKISLSLFLRVKKTYKNL